MIKRGDLRIAPIRREDLDFLATMRQDPVVFNNLGTFILPNEARQNTWFESLGNNNCEFLIIEVFRDKVWNQAGLVRITDIDYLNRSACVGADICKDFRGQGLSKRVYDLIFTLCFNKMNMNRLWLLVMSTNTIAKGLYVSLGFKYEGCQRSAILRDGVFIDYEMYSLLRQEFEESCNE